MKHNFEHYVSKAIGWVWLLALFTGSVTLVIYFTKKIFELLGVF